MRRDVQGLLATLRGLVSAGNAVVAVEHDPAVVAAADHVIEVGPGAGERGGRIVAAGAPRELPAESRTARLLAAPRADAVARSVRASRGELSVCGARLHHLKSVDAAFPVGCFTVVCGVSGSGKTSLLRGVLAASAAAGAAIGCDELRGLERFEAVVDDAGARAARVRTACPATLLGVYDELRKRFAATDAARARGFRAGHFSYLGKNGGACRACGGLGRTPAGMDLLGAAAWLPCEQCGGLRFDEPTLQVTWLGMHIADVLGATVSELLERLPAPTGRRDRLREPLQTAERLGLGYLRLGQGADTLSGGEAQRLHVARHLLDDGGETLFLLDEPTRGLHADDIRLLHVAIDQLVDSGNTVIAVEHDLATIAHADHVVELGPAAGEQGGRLVFAGDAGDTGICGHSHRPGAGRAAGLKGHDSVAASKRCMRTTQANEAAIARK